MEAYPSYLDWLQTSESEAIIESTSFFNNISLENPTEKDLIESINKIYVSDIKGLDSFE